MEMNPIALPQLRLGGALLRRGRQPLPRPLSLPLLSFAAAAARPDPQRGSRRRLRCAAVDGDGGPGQPSPAPQREDSLSGGLGAALEDPPPGPGTPPLVTDPLEFS
jgi:sec-independent protein translocase protein TatC